MIRANGYKWETEFFTGENIILHTFSKRIKVVSNIKTGDIKVLKDNIEVRKLNIPGIIEYEKFLLDVAKDTDKLKEFENNED